MGGVKAEGGEGGVMSIEGGECKWKAVGGTEGLGGVFAVVR